jgi:hypothetical protein
MKLEDLPPQVRLGVRVEIVRRQLAVTDAVVLVPDARSYVAAVARWTIGAPGRFPVLIDDGTAAGREEVGRFVRAFAPAKVVRWSAPETFPWPEDAEGRRGIVDGGVVAAWQAESLEKLAARFASVNHTPPGVVVASMKDPAWTAALALAAGRGQPIVWVEPPRGGGGGVGGAMSREAAEHLGEQVARGCAERGLEYARLGDAVDAVTLCLNVAVKVTADEVMSARGIRPFRPAPGEPVATTDVVGREPKTGERWAWAGQVIGGEREAAYRAMCGLFLQPGSAWLFDGYEDAVPFSAWDATAAGQVLEKAGMKVEVDDAARGAGLEAWRLRGAGGFNPAAAKDAERGNAPGGVWAGLICVNTSGMPESFDLKPVAALAGDVPLLGVPAVVHFVHSWSAARPTDASTIAGRFFRNGAYAYVGSVHEPFLQAFQPTPDLVKRLLGPAPLGAAARLDGGPPWRVAVLGDPLITVGAAVKRVAAEARVEGGVDAAEELGGLLKGRDFERAFALLVVLGRDRDVVRLSRAVLREGAQGMTEKAAAAGALAAFRRGELDLFVELAGRARGRWGEEPELVDGLWSAVGAQGLRATRGQVVLLSGALRPERRMRDVEEVARLLKGVSGAGAARAYVEGLKREAKSEQERGWLEEIVGRVVVD